MPFGAKVAITQRDWRCPTCRLAARASAGVLPLPNNPLIVAAVQALCCGGPNARLSDGGWRTARDGFPYYEFWSGSGGRIGVRVATHSAEEAWRIVEAFSALTLDTAVALLSGLCAAPFRSGTRAPRRESIRLGAPMVLAAKQYGRYGVERVEFAAAINQEINHLLLLRFEIHNYPGFSPKARAWSRAGINRADVTLFEIGDEAGERDPLECSMGRPLRLGAWADHWLNAGGPMWIGSLPQAILAMDHRDNRGADVLAKKTALLLALNWGAMRRGKTIHTDVRTFLRRIGELRRVSAAPMQHAGRFADRFQEALFRLSDAGILEVKVDSDASVELRAGGRPWFDTWLQAPLVVARPAFLSFYEADVAVG